MIKVAGAGGTAPGGWRRRLYTGRSAISWLAGMLALALLAVEILGIELMWGYAYSRGLYPNPAASALSPGQAAWANNKEICTLWDYLLFFPMLPLAVAVVSVVLKPNRRAAVVAVLSITCGLVVFWHLGLVDD